MQSRGTLNMASGQAIVCALHPTGFWLCHVHGAEVFTTAYHSGAYLHDQLPFCVVK